MIKVEIKNAQNISTHCGYFENNTDKNNWLSNPSNIAAWGGSGNYSVVESDVTSEFVILNQIETAEKDSIFGKYMAKKIFAMSQNKGLTNEQIDALYVDGTISKIRTMLFDGALETSRRNIASADLSAILTTVEKDAILAELDAYIG